MTIDYNDPQTWIENPDIFLRKARYYVSRWGDPYRDKEDLQMSIVEAMLKAFNKWNPDGGMKLSAYIWIAAKRSVLDYGRKYGEFSKGRYDRKMYTKFYQYDEAEVFEEESSPTINNYAKFKASSSDNHEDFDLIFSLKKENLLTRKIVFYYLFLGWNQPEIAKEFKRSEHRIWQILNSFRRKYLIESYQKEKNKFSSLPLEDLPMKTLDDIYELVKKQSRRT